ncbi:MAG: hypothetical protein HPY75_13680 [Actinobacteria bacterium]|nr:hypothetical protein [Actinomycetota bacterium]
MRSRLFLSLAAGALGVAPLMPVSFPARAGVDFVIVAYPGERVVSQPFPSGPGSAGTAEKDAAHGDADSYLYGANADEVSLFADTATGDVNGDGIADLVMGHDQGGTAPPYFYTGKVYVYYGRAEPAADVDLGTGADLTISGYTFSFSTGCSVACGDVNGDGIDDILIGAYLDTPEGLGTGPSYAGSVSVIFGSASLPTSWNFDTDPPDLYISSANGGEMCGMSVAAGDIDGDGYDDILFGAHLGNGGVHFGDGSTWAAQGYANPDSLYDVSMIDTTRGWAVGRYISAYDTIYRYDGASWSVDSTFHQFKRGLFGVASLDASHTWAVGAGGLIIFNNNYNDSKAWAAQGGGVTSSNLRDVVALSASNVWAVGDGGTILHYDGSSWSPQTSGTAVALRGVAAADASNVWAVGDGGTILHYDGSSWSPQASGTAVALRGVAAADASNVWAVGDGGTILETNDGGTGWSKQLVLFTQGKNAVDAVDASHAWAVGEAGTGRAYIVWGRAGGWPAWDYANPIPPNKVINGVDSLDSCGFPVSVGDLNGDPMADMLIGAAEANGPGNARNGAGEVYAVYGRPKGAFPYFVDLATQADCTIYGASPLDRIPTSMSRPLARVDGDRYDDIVLTSIWADGPGDARGGCGEVMVIRGGTLPGTVDLASMPPDITLYGPYEGAAAGRSVAVLDFDADGHPDIATGSTGAGKGAERPNCGAAWLVRGVSPWPSQVDLASHASMTFYGARSGDAFGFCLSGANLDGDPHGFDDLVISDVNGDGPGETRKNCGEHFLFLGHDFTPPSCSIVNVANGVVVAGTVGVEVEASDERGVEQVEFRVDGELKFTDRTAPYRWDWDTREYPDGARYLLEARAYDTSGLSAADAREVTTNNTIPPLSRTWYLAEGTTAWGFDTYVLVQNPNPEPTEVTFTFMKPGGEVREDAFTVPENSRFTILVNSFVTESDVSTRVDGDLPIICERAMYWNGRAGGHASIGVSEPSPTWYLAEGTTAWGFETYVLVQNPNLDPIKVTMTFMKPGGETHAMGFEVPGRARHTVNVNQVITESDVSTMVEASAPVICERAMYRYGKDLGHDSIGTPSPSREWYLAEGTTAWGFDTYVMVQNPNQEQAAVGMQFMLPGGGTVPYGVLVPGRSRYTVHLNEVPGCEDTDLSTFVTSDVPVICERAMYWRGASSFGGHDTIGTPLPSKNWYLAEGTTAWGFEEYVLVQNPNPEEAVVSFTFMKSDASTDFVSFPVPGYARFSLRVNDVVPESDVSVSVLADRPVICERAMYWGERNMGHATIGVRGP